MCVVEMLGGDVLPPAVVQYLVELSQLVRARSYQLELARTRTSLLAGQASVEVLI
jgi:hypothetical protein